jgi:preprotein translocase SecE subunit
VLRAAPRRFNPLFPLNLTSTCSHETAVRFLFPLNGHSPRKEECLLSEGNSGSINPSPNREEKRLGNWVRKLRFFASVHHEMKRVSRPTWREVRSTTTAVIIVVFALAGYLYVLDQIFYRLIDQMLVRHH